MDALVLRSLAGVPIEVITDTFNHVFSDYHVSVQLTTAQMQLKMQQEQIDLEWSVGAFNGDALVAIILHGCRYASSGKVLYNAGTGVAPAWRGRQLTERMYNWLVPRAIASGVQSVTLEVISLNDKAIHVYEKIGFRKQRHFNIWKGTYPDANSKKAIAFECPGEMQWKQIIPWWSADPCWSASAEAVEALEDEALILTARVGNNLVGYCCVVKNSGRLLQLCVAPHYRKKGMGSALLAEACRRLRRKDLLALNVDSSDDHTNRFFENMHWQKLLQQYEMTFSLLKT